MAESVFPASDVDKTVSFASGANKAVSSAGGVKRPRPSRMSGKDALAKINRYYGLPDDYLSSDSEESFSSDED